MKIQIPRWNICRIAFSTPIPLLLMLIQGLPLNGQTSELHYPDTLPAVWDYYPDKIEYRDIYQSHKVKTLTLVTEFSSAAGNKSVYPETTVYQLSPFGIPQTVESWSGSAKNKTAIAWKQSRAAKNLTQITYEKNKIVYSWTVDANNNIVKHDVLSDGFKSQEEKFSSNYSVRKTYMELGSGENPNSQITVHYRHPDRDTFLFFSGVSATLLSLSHPEQKQKPASTVLIHWNNFSRPLKKETIDSTGKLKEQINFIWNEKQQLTVEESVNRYGDPIYTDYYAYLPDGRFLKKYSLEIAKPFSMSGPIRRDTVVSYEIDYADWPRACTHHYQSGMGEKYVRFEFDDNDRVVRKTVTTVDPFDGSRKISEDITFEFNEAGLPLRITNKGSDETETVKFEYSYYNP